MLHNVEITHKYKYKVWLGVIFFLFNKAIWIPFLYSKIHVV